MDRHEVDISGVIAERQNNVALAIGGPVHNYAVLLTAGVNRYLGSLMGIDAMKKDDQRKANLKIYISMLYFVLASCPAGLTGDVVLDRDFDKRMMGQARKRVRELLKTDGYIAKYHLMDGRAGKGPAHHVAGKTARAKREADKLITADEIIGIASRLTVK
jgi:hypothetical protein